MAMFLKIQTDKNQRLTCWKLIFHVCLEGWKKTKQIAYSLAFILEKSVQ